MSFHAEILMHVVVYGGCRNSISVIYIGLESMLGSMTLHICFFIVESAVKFPYEKRLVGQ